MRLISLLSILLLITFPGLSQHYYLFIGTYTSGKSEGIYVYDFDASTGRANRVSSIKSTNPSFLAIAQGGGYVYSVNENGGDKQGTVSAYSFDQKTGQLAFINQEGSGGADPCFIAVDRDRKWAVVANYSGGSLSALPLSADGSVQPVKQLIQHEGKSVNTIRQEKAHVHSTFFSPDEHFILSPDLGMDELLVYRFNKFANQPLAAAKDSIVSVLPGSGPRHLAFHPSKPYLYLVDELTGTIDAYRYNNGVLKHNQRINTEPQGFQGEKGSADIHVSPNGKFLYASNRGDGNTIAVYSIDPVNGKLHINAIQSVLGKHPRNFIIEPGGRFLLVANRDTDNIVVFRINQQTGILEATGDQIAVPNPVCLKLLRK
jgi:6-phosphogluconolactonase